MSDTRPYPKILRTTVEADRALREYAARAHLAPFEALILAIGLLRTKDEREAASERAYKFAALWHDLARKLWHRWRSGLWALAREQNAADGLRREVASAREATRRADAEIARLGAELAAARAAPQPCACACALPAELDQRVRKRIAARPGRDLAFIVKNGCDRLEASDGYQDRQKAARKARS